MNRLFKVSLLIDNKTETCDLFDYQDRMHLSSLTENYHYQIANIETDDDWGNFDEYTSLYDILNVSYELGEFTDIEYHAFIKLALLEIYEPMDIIDSIKFESKIRRGSMTEEECEDFHKGYEFENFKVGKHNYYILHTL